MLPQQTGPAIEREVEGIVRMPGPLLVLCIAAIGLGLGLCLAAAAAIVGLSIALVGNCTIHGVW